MAIALRILGRRAHRRTLPSLSISLTPSLSSLSPAGNFIGKDSLRKSSTTFSLSQENPTHSKLLPSFWTWKRSSSGQLYPEYSTGGAEHSLEGGTNVKEDTKPEEAIKTPRPVRLTENIRKPVEEVGYRVINRYTAGDFERNKRPKTFSVIQTGAHQFKVSPGDLIYTEKLKFCDINDKDLPTGPQGSQEVCHSWRCTYSTLFDPKIYETAYRTVRYKSGKRKIREGIDEYTIDSFSKGMVPLIIKGMSDRSFQFQPVRREYLAQGEGKPRLIGTPSMTDDVIQEALRLILEPAFEHTQKFQRSARSTLQTIRKWTGTTWMVTGNMNGFLDNVDHTVLGNLIMKEVKDQQLLDLYWKLVRAGLVNNGGQQIHNMTGVSKAGVLSTLFTEIYLNEFDIWMKDFAASHSDRGGVEYGSYPVHSNFKTMVKSQDPYDKEDMQVLQQDRRDGGTRIHYIRYADQWVVGVDGPKSLAIKIRDNIKLVMKENLKLDVNNRIMITHLATNKCKFLGTLIGARTAKYTESLVGKRAQNAYGRIFLEAPINEIVSKLVEQGFAATPEWPRGMSAWIHLEAEEIIRRYRAMSRGVLSYYSIVDNKNMLQRVFWLLRYSAIFTLCRKWRMTTTALFKKLGTTSKYGDFLKGKINSLAW